MAVVGLTRESQMKSGHDVVPDAAAFVAERRSMSQQPITRRTMFTVITASAAAAISPSIAAEDHPDAALMALGLEFDRSAAEVRRLDIEQDKIYWGAWDDIAIPAALLVRSGDEQMLFESGCGSLAEGELYYIDVAVEIKEHADLIRNSIWQPPYIERAQEIWDARLAYEAEHRRIYAERGGPASQDALQAAHDRALELGQAIIQLRATTMQGVSVKARCHRWCLDFGYDHTMHPEFSDRIVIASLLTDCLSQNELTPPSAPASARAITDREAA